VRPLACFAFYQSQLFLDGCCLGDELLDDVAIAIGGD
jgi:hypothetical protein